MNAKRYEALYREMNPGSRLVSSRYAFTNQADFRADFWEQHPHLVCRRGPRGRILSQNEQPTDTRTAFVEWVDQMARSESISPAFAQRVTL